MTIQLQTGLPGACKTLYTLWRVENEMRDIEIDGEKVRRPVFYSGIKLKDHPAVADWQEINPEEWYTAPPLAIVVIDEAQRVFRPRASGSAVPRWESELETHRHGGIDIILMTQGPRLVSVNVRELVGLHLHAVRRWGMAWSTIHRWPECRLNVQSRKDSTQTQWKFKKEVYGWYQSSEAHTVRRQIPFKIWLFLSLPFILGALVWLLWGNIDKRMHPDKGTSSALTAGAPAQAGRASGPLTTAEYLAQQKPRINGLQYTAPAYDEVTKPVRAPYPAACVQSASKGCRCYSQQGTRLDVPKDLCVSISDGGFFMAWDERSPNQAQQPASAAAPAQAVPGTSGAIALSPDHKPRNPVRPDEPGGMAVLGANVAQAGSADGETLAWMRQR